MIVAFPSVEYYFVAPACPRFASPFAQQHRAIEPLGDKSRANASIYEDAQART
ncbi:MAG: hypothetical protein ACYDCD_11270 [Candidatus Acidiferrales bacterium]